jgi:hypothetical protein
MNITFRMPRGGHYWHAVPEGQAPFASSYAGVSN